MCDIAVADGAPCTLQFHTAVSTVNSGVTNVDCAANCTTSSGGASSINDFELLGGSQFEAHIQSSSSDNGHSSDADVKVQKHDQKMITWQRSRSLLMAVLGFVIRVCFTSEILSRYIQVTCLTYFFCCSF